MNLVIVESPTKARTLKQYLGKDYDIEASMGHVRDLPKSTLGVDVAHDFVPEYVKSEGKSAVISKLKKLSKDAEKIFLATDPDREGEAISWHIQSLLEESAKSKKEKEALSKKFSRATFHEITKSAILDAIEHPTTLNLNLVDAQQARRVVDRLVGYYLSPVLWKKVRRGLSAGRVQSVALRLIVEREKERLAFIPEEYWEIYVDTTTQEKVPIRVQLVEVEGKPFTPHKKEDVDPLIAQLAGASYSVADVQSTKRVRAPFAPFTTSTLQQAGANKLGFTSKRTMKLAQDLYEQGLITYHRTDSVNLSTQAVTAAREQIATLFGPQYVSNEPRLFQTKSKNAQEAHEAIRPTNVQNDGQGILGKGLDESHVKLYDLIWRRFMATQMADANYNQTALFVTGKATQTFGLKANGSVLTFDGWMKLFPGSEDVLLPDVHTGDALNYQNHEALQKFTQPPARFNDASLVKTLEKLGIGRPSTYASIISVLEIRGYVEREQKAFVPTSVGTTVVDFLVTNFPQELDYQFTANMEDDLDAIARGEKQWINVMKSFFGPFEKNVQKVTKDADRMQVPVEEFGSPCPLCGGEDHPEQERGKLVIRSGRFGKFISCSRYPECTFTAKIIYTVQGLKCPECNEGEIRQKHSSRGREFYGCSRYPACKWTSWMKPGTTENPVVMGYMANPPKKDDVEKVKTKPRGQKKTV